MILEIKIKNFFSIRDEVILDLRAAKSKSSKSMSLEGNTIDIGQGEKVLKTVAIYGSNASGKSSVIKAIRFCCSMVFESHNHNENTVYNFKPFKLDSKIDEPSEFGIRFLMEGIQYYYTFSLTTTQILKEALYFYPKGKQSRIFERDENAGNSKNDKYKFSGEIKRPLDVAESTSNKTLYVSRASQMDRSIAKKVFSFFNETFILNYHGQSIEHVNQIISDEKQFILKALQIADSDIVNIECNKEKVKSQAIRLNINQFGKDEISNHEVENEVLKITTYHKSNPKVPFDFYTEESDGTQKLMFIILKLLDIIRNKKILMIDEIETSLHTKIVEYILWLFKHSTNSQLIFTTHNTNLLNFDLLRKDQIYFVSKAENGSSELYTLYDFKDFRENMDPEKGYLMGRFNAIPFLDYSQNIFINEN